jgi:hypothetical protein
LRYKTTREESPSTMRGRTDGRDEALKSECSTITVPPYTAIPVEALSRNEQSLQTA